MKIVFIVSLGTNRRILSYFSVVSGALKHLGCKAEIFLLTDEVTGCDASLAEAAAKAGAKLIVKPVNGYEHTEPVVRSRFLKSKMRTLVKGDFIYLDCDTLPLVDPTTLVSNRSVAAAPDSHLVGLKSSLPCWIASEYQAMGWSSIVFEYLNSGVILWKDTPQAHFIGDSWHKRWVNLYLKRSFYKDQASFNSVLSEHWSDVEVLPQRWNGLVSFDPFFCRDASIFHFFTDKVRRHPNLLDALADDFEYSGHFNGKLFDRFAKIRDPWAGRPCGFLESIATRRYMAAAKFALGGLYEGKPIPSLLFLLNSKQIARPHQDSSHNQTGSCLDQRSFFRKFFSRIR